MGDAPRRLIDNPTPETPSGFPLLTDAAGRARLMEAGPTEMAAWEVSLMTWLDGAARALPAERVELLLAGLQRLETLDDVSALARLLVPA